MTDTAAIEALLDRLIADNPGQVALAQKNPKVAGWFTGQVMKATGGKANPGVVNQLVTASSGWGDSAGALRVQAPGAAAGGEQIEEDEAEQDRGVAAVDRRVESSAARGP